MKSMRNAHIVVVGDCERGRLLAAQLRRMALARVTTVAEPTEAQVLCQRGEAHVCIVVRPELNPDQAPPVAAEAPGRGSGVPSMIMVPVVTAYVRKVARRDGYMAALPANIAARVLYRRVRAALQCGGGRRGPHRRRPAGPGLPALVSGAHAPEAKPTLH